MKSDLHPLYIMDVKDLGYCWKSADTTRYLDEEKSKHASLANKMILAQHFLHHFAEATTKPNICKRRV
jgi:hypothetical protein